MLDLMRSSKDGYGYEAVLRVWRGEHFPGTISRLVLVLPLAVLTMSFLFAPYVPQVREITQGLPSLPTTPVLLYRHEHTAFFYTSVDLLHPEEFGSPAEYIEAVVFDVWPAGEGVTHDAVKLTWVVRIWNAIKGEDKRSTTNLDVAERFRAAIGGQPRINRGEAVLFELPQVSTYRQQSGIRQFAALGTRVPDPSETIRKSTPQLFSTALEDAFQKLKNVGVLSVGVPKMIARTTMDEEGSRTKSWQMILREADAKARAVGIRRVLFGGWRLTPKERELTDTAFRTAWESYRLDLVNEAKVVTHERLRIAAIVAFIVLLRWHFRRRELSLLRVLALVVSVAGLSLAIAEAGAWLAKNINATATVVFVAECIVAIGAGAVLEQIVRFDPKKILEQDEVEKKS